MKTRGSAPVLLPALGRDQRCGRSPAAPPRHAGTQCRLEEEPHETAEAATALPPALQQDSPPRNLYQQKRRQRKDEAEELFFFFSPPLSAPSVLRGGDY